MKNKRNIKLAVVAMSVCQGLQYTVTPVLNQVQARFPEVPQVLVQLLVMLPAVPSMLAAMLAGWLAAKMSKKPLVVLGAGAMGVFGLLPLVREDFWLLFTSRILLGVGLGLLTALNTAVVAEHFEGAERSRVMGLQGASVGAGILLSSSLAGVLGRMDYRGAYWLHALALLLMAALHILLPDTGRAAADRKEQARINRHVLALCAVSVYEMLFLSTFTTNIALHLEGSAAEATALAGMLTACFSGIQIAAGLLLGRVFAALRQWTLPAAMLCCGAGSLLICLFPQAVPVLVAGAALCGISQGLYVPQAMFEVAGLVPVASSALAAAVLTASINVGQFLSPVAVGALETLLSGGQTTGGAFLLAGVCMLAGGGALGVYRSLGGRAK